MAFLLAALPGSSAGPQAAAFEVASIKPAVLGRTGYEGTSRSKVEPTPNRLTMSNVDLNECIQWAYGARGDQISGGNVGGDRYAILAKSAATVPVSQLRIMLQDLLAKRFKLVLRRETKLLPVYELIVAKHGPKLPAPIANDGNDAVSSHHSAESLPRVEEGSFVFAETSIAEFAQKLSMLLRG